MAKRFGSMTATVKGRCHFPNCGAELVKDELCFYDNSVKQRCCVDCAASYNEVQDMSPPGGGAERSAGGALDFSPVVEALESIAEAVGDNKKQHSEVLDRMQVWISRVEQMEIRLAHLERSAKVPDLIG